MPGVRISHRPPRLTTPLCEGGFFLYHPEMTTELDAGLDAVFAKARDLWAAGQPSRALPIFAKLADALPGHADLQAALGVCLFETGDIEAARQSLEQALAIDPSHGVAAYNLAHILLLNGDYERGFALYERRWTTFPRAAWLPPPDAMWDGSPFQGTLLVVAEQGFGDAIHFARFLPLAAQRAGTLILIAPRELARLLAALPGVGGVITAGDPVPRFDQAVMLMSLPYVLGMSSSAASAAMPPYLTAPSTDYFPEGNFPEIDGFRFKAGLIWGGRARTAQEKLRVAGLEMFAPLAETPDVAFYSLQMGEHRDQLPLWPGKLADLSPSLTDFAATAAVLSRLDLLVTVDTAAAHLAGALGRPAFVLVPEIPHWVWGRSGGTTPWYPSLKLFRAQAGGFAPCIAGIASALALLVDSRLS
jgi:hypothetical protein